MRQRIVFVRALCFWGFSVAAAGVCDRFCVCSQCYLLGHHIVYYSFSVAVALANLLPISQLTRNFEQLISSGIDLML